MPASRALRKVKAAHTAIWVTLVVCILAIPVLGWARMYDYVLLLSGIVWIEILVLFVNDWRCPLTSVAARYTEDRNDNFDIFLPVWVARNNKLIFGPLFVAGEIFVLGRWLGWFG